MKPLAVSASRKIAFDVLGRVAAEDAYASELLHSKLDASVKPEDAALATEISLGVLRWQRLLDTLLARHTKKPIQRLDAAVAIALRMGLYQIRLLERIPARAAVSESVELVKFARKTSAATLVNAVLRRCADEAKVPAETLLAAAKAEASRATWLAVLHSHPTWLVERWLARYGELQTIAILESNNRPARVSCHATAPDKRDELIAELERSGLQVSPGTFLRDAFSVSAGSIARSAPFRAGHLAIQDEASQAIPLLLSVEPGQKVLDLCCAPGGKTAILARASAPHGSVVASDFHSHRLRATRDQIIRVAAKNVHVVQLDAAKPLPFAQKFDRILVDAPCSGTGTLARHPEIRWRLSPDQLASFKPLQSALLAMALENLTPGGRLLYSTCSIEREENEAIVSAALAAQTKIRRIAAPEAAVPLKHKLAPGIDPAQLFDDAGQFHTLPGAYGTDGFFAALLERLP
ncbi:MAG: 16S rRNA (cytosine(967)-C(5))-methyltransferase RsmB [Candidatus Acidiferrales bacterium]